jgi:hypothetical protein
MNDLRGTKRMLKMLQRKHTSFVDLLRFASGVKRLRTILVSDPQIIAFQGLLRLLLRLVKVGWVGGGVLRVRSDPVELREVIVD